MKTLKRAASRTRQTHRMRRPRCPNGTRRNKAGLCVKKEAQPKAKVCPPGKTLNPKTNRCKKDPVKKVKKVKKKKTLKPCPPGKVRNPKTNRCKFDTGPDKGPVKKPVKKPMSDLQKRADEIEQWAIETKRNPTDTAGMDSDDGEWLGENPEWEDYIEDQYAEVKRKSVKKPVKKPVKTKTKWQKMADEIYEMWPVLKKAGEKDHDFDEHYIVDPKNWSYPPEYLADSKNEDDHDMLEGNWKQVKEEYETVTKKES